MTRVFAACVAAVMLALGCKSGEEPARGAHQGIEPVSVYHPRPEVQRMIVETPVPEPREVPVVAEDEKEEAKRDLAAELNAAVGVPTDCARDFEAVNPTTLRITLSATVRPSGRVIEPAVYGSGLSEAARQCIGRRAAAVVLRPLDDEVSQRVSTTIEIEYVPPAIVEADPGVPEPRLRNVREPLPKRREVAPSGRPIMDPISRPIMDPTSRPIQEPTSRKIRGPKPRPIDGYDVDENAQEWR
jgi:hypothetical protein